MKYLLLSELKVALKHEENFHLDTIKSKKLIKYSSKMECLIIEKYIDNEMKDMNQWTTFWFAKINRKYVLQKRKKA